MNAGCFLLLFQFYNSSFCSLLEKFKSGAFPEHVVSTLIVHFLAVIDENCMFQIGKPFTDRDKQNGKGKKKVKLEQQRKAEEEQRKEGLGAAIPSSNIGFKMLQQMGYTPGAALGKHGQGVLEPVSVDLKRSRTGLGRDVAIKEEQILKARRAEFESVKQRQAEKELRADFQQRRKSSWQSRKIASDYAKASATLTDLEERLTSSSSPKAESLSTFDKAETETAEEKVEEEEEITLEVSFAHKLLLQTVTE